MKNDTSYILLDHEPCYYKLGLTTEDIDDYKRKGKIFDYKSETDVERFGFYGRIKSESDNIPKDEL